MHIIRMQTQSVSICRQLLLTFVFLLPVFSTAQYSISKISFSQQNVFDTSIAGQNNFISNLANSIHYLTREQILRNALLYHSGDTLNQDLIKETERNLRALGFVGDVSTDIDTLNDSLVTLTIHTHDKWTLALSPSYKQGGGVRTFSLTLKDDNLLGYGQSLSLSYDYNSERTKVHGVEVIFSEPQLLQSRWKTKLQYKNSEQLLLASAAFERPYFSDKATWATGLYADFNKALVPTYVNGVKISEDYIVQENQNAYLSKSYGDETKLRTSLAVVRSYSTGSVLRVFDNLTMMNFSLDIMQRFFDERMYLNGNGIVEDVPKGFLGNLTLGKNFRFTQQNSPAYYLNVAWQHIPFSSEHFYFSYFIQQSIFLGGTDNGERTFNWAIVQNYKPVQTHVFICNVSGVFGSGWSPGRRLYLGTAKGLRGYPNYRFDGQRRLVYNFEYRLFSDKRVWIFKPGAAIFFDSGAAWNESESITSKQFYHSVGLGLRISNTLQQGLGAICIDFAYNFELKRLGEIIISSSIPINAFQGMGFTSPVTVE